MKTTSVLALALSLLAFGQNAVTIPEGWFAFPVDPRVVSSDNLGSVEFLNSGPATERIIIKNGHFATVSGNPVRFFGSNLCYDCAFPDKDIAPALARRMKQLGFNVIRFHHMDNRHILNKEKDALDPVQLDKLHWFMFQLRENGIYSNLNLHVSRVYKGMGTLDKTFHYGKGLDRFYPPFIESQKKYARALLTTVNPYTHLAPVDDPMVAFVEINNENSISLLDNMDHLELLRNHAIGLELKRQWQRWLAGKYASYQDMLNAWQNGFQPYSDVNLLGNINFLGEGVKDGAFEIKAVGPRSFDCRLLQDGPTAWAYQLHFPGIVYKEGQNYTITFKARSTANRSISVNLGLHQPPWKNYSSHRVRLTPEWKEFSLLATVVGLMPDKLARFTFNLGGFQTGTDIQLRDIELHEGNRPIDYGKQISFETTELPSETSSSACHGDYREFLIDTEYANTKMMVEYLKHDLALKALVIDTQGNYTGAFGLLRESELCDYIDMHSYWEHPHFAEGHSWSPLHWTIPNTPMASSANGGNFQTLPRAKIVDKPFSISEYDHPTPNEHNAEMFPMIGSFCAFQDWDAFYQFSYASPWTKDRTSNLSGYFAMSPHPSKMVMAPLAALMFRGRLIDTAAETATVTVPVSALKKQLPSRFSDMSAGHLAEYPANVIGNVKFQTRLTTKGTQITCDAPERLTGLPLKSPQIEWTAGENRQGSYLVNAPCVRAATGYIGNRDLKLGDVSFRLTLTPEDTAAAVIAALDNRPLKESRHMLLAIAGKIANPGMTWNETRTSVTNKWGQPPTIAPFIPFTVKVPGTDKPTVKVLDGAGNAIGELTVSGTPDNWIIVADCNAPSLWFAIVR